MLKARYVGKGHTFVKINTEKIFVLENEVIEIPADKKSYFLSNGFELVGGRDEGELKSLISKIKQEIANENNGLKITSKQILDKAKKEVNELEEKIKGIQEDRKRRMKEYEKELERVEEDKRYLEQERKAEIERLKKEQKEQEKIDNDIKVTIGEIKQNKTK